MGFQKRMHAWEKQWQWMLILSGLLLVLFEWISSQFTWFDLFESYSFSIDFAHFGFGYLAFLAGLFWCGSMAEKHALHLLLHISADLVRLIFCSAILASAAYHLFQSTQLFAPWLYTQYFSYESYYYATPTLIAFLFMFFLSLVATFHFRKRNKDLSYLWKAALLVCFVPTVSAILFAINKTDITAILEWIHFGFQILLTLELFMITMRQTLKKSNEEEILMETPAPLEEQTVQKPPESLPPPIEKAQSISKKSMWSVRFSLSLLPWCLLCGLILLMLSTCIFTVAPHQEALVFRFGALADETVKEAGLHFKWPIPIETVSFYDVDRVQALTVGYEDTTTNNDYLWITNHSGEEYTLLTGNGNELLSVNMRLNYRISDVMAYHKNYQNAPEVLTAHAYTLLMKRTNTIDLNTILMVDRTVLSKEMCEELNAFSEQMALGLEVVEVIMESIHPAVEVAYVYQNVVNANIGQTTARLEAQGYQISMINDAMQQKTSMINDATARGLDAIAFATNEMAVFEAAMQAYEGHEEPYLLRKHLSAYENWIRNTSLYVFSPKAMPYMSRFVIQNGANTVVIK